MTANLSAMNLLLATRNQHKTREFTQLLGPNFTLRDLTRPRASKLFHYSLLYLALLFVAAAIDVVI